jgi:thioredoxin reductase (NADPH)
MDDCIIIGAGPAGLTAAIYLARYHLSIRLFDSGDSRAALIPCTHTHAGFPGGISGEAVLERMREQAREFGAIREEKRVEHLARVADGFTVGTGLGTYRARTVLVATGAVNLHPPQMEDALQDEALARGLLRYCPVCDGYEVTDTRIAVIGSGNHGTREAEFLRGYTADITLVAPDKALRLKPEDQARLEEAGIACVDGPAQAVAISKDFIVVETAEGAHTFDSIYPALGSDTHVQLAEQLGAELSSGNCIRVDAHMRTSVPGLYSAGDVVIGLDQISHAMGQGGVAATTIRNDLAEQRPLRR